MEPQQGRWVWEDDDVPLHDMPNDFNCERLVEMYQHVLDHMDAGHDVPDRCLQSIQEEIDEGSPYDKSV